MLPIMAAEYVTVSMKRCTKGNDILLGMNQAPALRAWGVDHRSMTSQVFSGRSSHAFCLGTTALAIQSAFPGSRGGPCLASGLGSPGRRPHQFRKTLPGIQPVSLLGAETPCVDDQHPVLVHPPASEPDQPLLHVLRQGGGLKHVKAQLNGCGDLVHVLSPRPGRAHEDLLNLPFINGDRRRDPDHGRPSDMGATGRLLKNADPDTLGHRVRATAIFIVEEGTSDVQHEGRFRQEPALPFSREDLTSGQTGGVAAWHESEIENM